jgi:hypothetical protein
MMSSGHFCSLWCVASWKNILVNSVQCPSNLFFAEVSTLTNVVSLNGDQRKLELASLMPMMWVMNEDVVLGGHIAASILVIHITTHAFPSDEVLRKIRDNRQIRARSLLQMIPFEDVGVLASCQKQVVGPRALPVLFVQLAEKILSDSDGHLVLMPAYGKCGHVDRC